MQVDAADRDRDWLKESLQTAVELEMATLPVYLIGMWSIKDGSGEVFNLIDSVIMEEMLHLGLVCNMLKAIGGSPQIRVPDYPGPLPGGVRPGLEVFLAGLTRESVAMYMEIEKPESFVRAEAEAEGFPTIGDFYNAIRDAFHDLPPPQTLSTNGQLERGLSVPKPDGSPFIEDLKVLETVAHVDKQIDVIKEQGEGTSTSPEVPQPKFLGELAHYFRFSEIHEGKRLKPVDGHFEFSDDPADQIPFPECLNVPKVPREGYPNLSQAKEFNVMFTRVVRDVQAAWNGEPQKLGTAIGPMTQLAGKAQAVMAQKLLPDDPDDKRFGPDFKVLPP
jgi:Ferritin-like